MQEGITGTIGQELRAGRSVEKIMAEQFDILKSQIANPGTLLLSLLVAIPHPA